MSFHLLFLLALAFVTFIVAPIALVAAFIHGMRTKASDRKDGGGGGMSNAVAGAMLELDRLFTRPSVEHTIETEKQTLKREDDRRQVRTVLSADCADERRLKLAV